MGFESNPAQDQANAMADQQMRQQSAENKQKLDELRKTRLGIIKSQTGPNYEPDKPENKTKSSQSKFLGPRPNPLPFGE